MLSDAQARKARPAEKPYKLADQGGLYLYVTPSGGKYWRLKYRVDGKDQIYSIGPYPEVSLSEARDEQEAAKKVIRAGGKPKLARDKAVAARRAEEAVEAAATDAGRKNRTFEALAREWHALQEPGWTQHHAMNVLNSLQDYVFPEVKGLLPDEIDAPKVLEIIRKIEARPAIETAHRVRQRMSAVFIYAMSMLKATNDPAGLIKPALAKVVKGQQPAIVSLDGVRKVLSDCEALPGHVVTRLALRFVALTAVRSYTLRTTPWAEFRNLMDGDVWVVPAERMKMGAEFLVPLSRQAKETLQVLHTITGGSPYAFPNDRSRLKPMSENALGYMLNRAGYHGRHVPHGFRSSFSTIMHERYPGDSDIIDLMLAHVPTNTVKAAYNRARHLDRRRELAQIWADILLEGLPHPETLLELPRKGVNQAT